MWQSRTGFLMILITQTILLSLLVSRCLQFGHLRMRLPLMCHPHRLPCSLLVLGQLDFFGWDRNFNIFLAGILCNYRISLLYTVNVSQQLGWPDSENPWHLPDTFCKTQIIPIDYQGQLSCFAYSYRSGEGVEGSGKREFDGRNANWRGGESDLVDFRVASESAWEDSLPFYIHG